MKRQRGIALISAVLVSALAAILAAAMAREQMLSVHRTANVFQAEQAWAYARGLESWARKVLAEDARDRDGATDAWRQALPPLTVQGGMLAGSVQDLNSRFNLNNLITTEGPDELQLQRFRRLLAALSLDPSLADAVVDWMDPDSLPRAGGFEDNEYLSRQPPYRAANRMLVSASELRAVAGVDGEAWSVLEPHVTALPRRTSINVNTATAPVLMSLDDSMSRSTADLLIQGRDRKPYSSVDDFLADAGFPSREGLRSGLGVSSDFFLTRGVVTLGDIELSLFSVLYRGDTGAIQTVARSQTVY